MRKFLADYGFGIIAALTTIFVFWFLVIRPIHQGQEAARSRANEIAAEAQVQATGENVRTIERYHTEVRQIEHTVRENSNTIRTSRGAAQAIDPALHSAGLHGLCLLSGDSDECQRLLRGNDNGVGGERPRADAEPSN